MRKKISGSRNKFEDLIQMAKNSEQWMNFLYSSLSKLVEPLQNLTPAMRVDKQEEYETLLGNKIPNEVDIYPPTVITSKGGCKRIRKSKEKNIGSGGQGKNKQKCSKCKQVVDHIFADVYLSCALYRVLFTLFAMCNIRISAFAVCLCTRQTASIP